jgi:hypothetical protein
MCGAYFCSLCNRPLNTSYSVGRTLKKTSLFEVTEETPYLCVCVRPDLLAFVAHLFVYTVVSVFQDFHRILCYGEFMYVWR